MATCWSMVNPPMNPNAVLSSGMAASDQGLRRVVGSGREKW